jgi:alkylhydroperoxidase/carboxymuconolactone decarboxylase family protein YurZ
MARAFTPQLAKLIENPLYSDVWTDPALSPRDRSIATVAALVALYTSRVLCRLSRGRFRVGHRCTDADGLTRDILRTA